MNCNGMKISALIAAASMVCAPLAMADTLWSTGVSREQGWYDFNKARDGAQSEMCWAICAANLIAWWQNAQPEQSLPSGVPMGDEVWDIYKQTFTNVGSDPDQGIRWWYSGKYDPMFADEVPSAAITTDATGSYYADREGQGDEFFHKLIYRGRGNQVNAETVTRALYEGFSRGDAFWIGVSFYRRNGELHTHSLSVWGVDVEPTADATPKVVALYMTDSDDGNRCLHRIPLKVEDGMLKFDCPQHPLYGRIGDITITNYTGLYVKE